MLCYGERRTALGEFRSDFLMLVPPHGAIGHALARRRGDRDDGTLREQLILILGLLQPWFRAGSADLAEVRKCEKPCKYEGFSGAG